MGLQNEEGTNKEGETLMTPKHNYNNCCSFCKTEKLVTQTIRRIAYGRAETPSARNHYTTSYYERNKEKVKARVKETYVRSGRNLI